MAAGQVNVPAALFTPPLKTKLATVVIALELNAALLVNKPVKVVIAVLVIVKPFAPPAFIVKAPANVILFVPAIVTVPTVTVTAPAKLVNAALVVILCVALNVTAPVPDLLNVPELVIPPPKTKAEVLAVAREPEPLIVNKPVNVFVPPLFPSLKTPVAVIVVVPPTVKLWALGSSVPVIWRLTPAPNVHVAVNPL